MRNCQKAKLDGSERPAEGAATDRRSPRKDRAGQALHLHQAPEISGAKVKDQKNGTRELSVEERKRILALYDEYQPRLFLYVASLDLRRDLVEEVVQETFMRLATQLSEGKKIGNMRGWIVRVAHNLVVNLLKSERHPLFFADAPAFVIENCVDPAVGPDETYRKIEQVRRIKSALPTLTPQYRQCFEMRVAGFSCKDIGFALGISEQRVSVILKEATVKLAQMCG
jgi:RNA polymerase sigma-70 factor, ECF subfamily